MSDMKLNSRLLEDYQNILLSVVCHKKMCLVKAYLPKFLSKTTTYPSQPMLELQKHADVMRQCHHVKCTFFILREMRSRRSKIFVNLECGTVLFTHLNLVSCNELFSVI